MTKSSTNDVSVVIPALNEENYIEKCLKSMVLQKKEPDEVIIVIDKRSSDNTEKIAKEFERKYENFFVIKADKAGPSRNRNLGIKKASSPIIAFTDADAWADENWLKELSKPLLNGNYVATYGDIKSSEGQVAIWPYKVFPSGHKRVTCNIAYRKNVLEKVGMFDEGIDFGGGEDTDLALKVEGEGKFSYQPSAIVYHPVKNLSIKEMVTRAIKRKRHEPLLYKRHGKRCDPWRNPLLRPKIGPFSPAFIGSLAFLFLIIFIHLSFGILFSLVFLLFSALITYSVWVTILYKVATRGQMAAKVRFSDKTICFFYLPAYVFSTILARLYGSIKWKKILI